MAAEIISKKDLQLLRIQLVSGLKAIFMHSKQQIPETLAAYKTSDVRKIPGCSVNKLVALRVARKLGTKKVGGTIYYSREDIKRLLEEGY